MRALSKLSTNSKQYAIAQRLLKSYFVSLHALLASVSTQSDIPSYAVTESANLVPWIVGNRKIARGWVKMLIGVYDSASDEVRVQAFAALRKLAIAADHSLRESIMKVSQGLRATSPGWTDAGEVAHRASMRPCSARPGKQAPTPSRRSSS